MDAFVDSGNSKNFVINLDVDRKYAAEVLRAIISTILFHRSFGSLAPETHQAVGITYPAVSNADTERILNEKTKEITRKSRDTSIKNIGVKVEFFTLTAKKTVWFAKTYNSSWESWNVHLKISPSDVPKASMDANLSADINARSATSKELHKALMEVLNYSDRYKDHIPPISTTDVSPFPYEILIS